METPLDKFWKEDVKFDTKQLIFNKRRLKSSMLVDKKFWESDPGNEEYCQDQIQFNLEAYVLEHCWQKKQVDFTFERPSFLDWLFRRKRKVRIDLDIKDILIDPPKLPKDRDSVVMTWVDLESRRVI
jgi:hypothetical protein